MNRARRRRQVLNRATIVRQQPTPTSDNSWYRLENNAASASAALYLYDEIGYYGISANDLIAELAELDVRNLDVHISSPGGEIFQGIAIMTALQSHSAYVTVYIDSLAASIASVIAQAGDKRIIAPAAEMMIHNASGMCVGTAKDMRELADVLDRQTAKIASIYADRAGGRRDTWRNRMDAETWFSAEEAVAAGLADEVGKPKRRTEPPMANSETGHFRYANRNAAPAPDLSADPGEPDDDETEDASLGTDDGEAREGAEETAGDATDEQGEESPAGQAEDAAEVVEQAETSAEPANTITLRFDPDNPNHEAVVAFLADTFSDSASADRPSANLVMVGEQGRELVRLPIGSQIIRNGGGDPDGGAVNAAPTDPGPASPPTTAHAATPPEPDPWTDLTAHLTTDEQPQWADLVASLTTSPATDDTFASLTEAFL